MKPAIERSVHELQMARVDEALFLVRQQVEKAIRKHRPMHSPHEGHSVIREEFEELWDHVKADTATGHEAGIEALQLAAMGVRYVVDVIEVPLGELK